MKSRFITFLSSFLIIYFGYPRGLLDLGAHNKSLLLVPLSLSFLPAFLTSFLPSFLLEFLYIVAISDSAVRHFKVFIGLLCDLLEIILRELF